MLNPLAHLKQDWITFETTRNYFMIIMLKFKEPETELKLTGNCIKVI